jgi:hypothetical protein
MKIQQTELSFCGPWLITSYCQSAIIWRPCYFKMNSGQDREVGTRLAGPGRPTVQGERVQGTDNSLIVQFTAPQTLQELVKQY